MMKNNLILTCSAIGLLLAADVAHATVVLSDGTLNSSDYALDFNSEPGYSPGTGSLSQVTSGGNPGDYQEDIFHVSAIPEMGYPMDANYPYGVTGAAINKVVIYNPAAMGGISSINFSADMKGDAAGDSDVFIDFFVEQNGVLFETVPVNPPHEELTANWANYSENGLDLTSFYSVSSNAGSHPLDFSAGGAPIEFGVGVSITSNVSPDTDAFDLDNFVVDIESESVPEPSTWAALAAGLVLLIFWRGAKAARLS